MLPMVLLNTVQYNIVFLRDILVQIMSLSKLSCSSMMCSLYLKFLSPILHLFFPSLTKSESAVTSSHGKTS